DMQNKKTGALMGFCTEVAPLLSHKNELAKTFRDLGIKIGLLFQIADDFLDKYGKSETLGKPTQQDESKGKNTLIVHLGEEKTKALIADLKSEITNQLSSFSQTDELLNCINFIIERKN
ncbi:MAG: polyprenyl synthetase family protein, partial [Pelagibacteraceae bacterium]